MEDGCFRGVVLDAGCGSGENALLIASRGFAVLGFDVAETALARARRKAEERGLAAEFALADALQLQSLQRSFDTILDCGLFHTFDAEERLEYASSLSTVANRDATLYVLCFRDDGPETGPHPMNEQDLRIAFNAESGWEITSIEPDRVRTRFHGESGAPAWLAKARKV